MLLASITQSTFEEAFQEMERARPFAEGFEFRLDYFKDLSWLKKLKQNAQLPVMFTFGNLFPSEAILSLAPDFCDIPAEHFEAAKKFPHLHWVGSYHNFDETPADLANVLEKMKNPCFHSYKIAAKSNSTLDMLRLMAFKKCRPEALTIETGREGLNSNRR